MDLIAKQLSAKLLNLQCLSYVGGLLFQANSQDFRREVTWMSDVYVSMHKHASLGHAPPGNF